MIRSKGMFVRGTGTLAFCLVLGLTQLASASILGGILARGPNGLGDDFTINTLNDTNIEQWIPEDGDLGDTVVEVGDRFNLFLNFQNINSDDLPQTYAQEDLVDVVSATYQLAAIGEFVVASIADNGDGTGTFEFDGEILVYESAAPASPIDFSDDPVTMRANIEATTLIATFATVDASDFITGDALPLDLATVPIDFADAVRTKFGLTMTSGDLLLTREVLTGGLTYDLAGFTDVWRASSAQLANGWFAQSNTNASVAAVIPEPGSFAIMGFLACIFGCVAVRRNSRK